MRLRKIHACHSGLRAGIQDNKLADFLTGSRIKASMTVLLCVCLLTLTACDNKETSAPESKPTIKIGVLLPLTGDVSKEAKELRDVLLYTANQDVNSNIDIEIIIEDTAGKTMRAISAAKKLISVDKVNAIITVFSGEAQVVSPIATKNNILHIGMVANGNIENNKTSFTFYPSPEQMAKKYIEFLKQDGAIKNIGVLVLSHATCEAIYSGLEQELKKTNIKFRKYSFIPGQENYVIDILKIKENKHDMLTLLLYPPELDIITKQLTEASLNNKLSGIATLELASNFKLLENAFSVEVKEGNVKEIAKAKKEIKATGDYLFAVGIDTINIIKHITSDFYKENKRVANGSEMAKKLINMGRYNGVSGELIINKNRKIYPPSVIKQIKNGKAVLVEEK